MADDRDVRNAVRSDEGLTIALLRYANSAWFARRHRVETVDQALTVIGLTGLRSLIVTEFLGAFFTHAGPVDEFLWEHALASAIAIALPHPSASRETEERYLCGLLHNVGKAIMNAEDPHGYAEVVRRVTERGEDFCAAERAVFSTVHLNTGAVFLEEVPLPRIVKDTTLYHHAPDDAPASIAIMCRKVLLADTIAYHVSPAWRALRAADEEPPWQARRTELDPSSSSSEDIVTRELCRMRTYFRLPRAGGRR